VKKALTDAGISMPDDAREIIFPQGVPILTDHAIEQPAPVAESSRARTNAEAALKNDQDEITERAAKADIAEDDGNLLL
jgi:F0F1-type ATP synthase epsilon subunit